MATSKKKAAAPKKDATSKTAPAKAVKKATAKPAAKKADAKKVASKSAEKAKPSTKAAATKTATKTAASKPAAKAATPKKAAAVKKATPAKAANSATKKVAPEKAGTKTAAKKVAAKAATKPTATKASATKKAEAAKKAAAKTATKKATTPAKERPAAESHQKLLKKAVKAKKASDKKKTKKEKPFVMPKIETSKARKYNPRFTRSILDQPEDKPTGPTMRYNDTDLQEFREIIARKLESAKKELAYLQGLITRKDQMGGDESDNRYMTMEDGSLSMEREQLAQMASRQITFIDHLEKALVRIENKTYGICRVTGKLIDKARLRAVPHATLSIEAKMGMSR